MFRIGEVATILDVSADTLRYYEKIKLLPPVSRNNGGIRFYSDKDLVRIRFIKRAQKMGFRLAEIAQLLSFKENPQQAKPQVKKLAREKLEAVIQQVDELSILRDELTLLTNLCEASELGCPILEGLDGKISKVNSV